MSADELGRRIERVATRMGITAMRARCMRMRIEVCAKMLLSHNERKLFCRDAASVFAEKQSFRG